MLPLMTKISETNPDPDPEKKNRMRMGLPGYVQMQGNKKTRFAKMTY